MITTETELPSSQGGVSYSMKIYSMPEGFLTDQEVPVRWRILGILNGFHINGKDLYASNDWLARQLGCSERSISNGVKELEKRGEVYCERTKTSRIIKRTIVDDSQVEGSKRLLPPSQTASIPGSKRLLPISLSNSLNIKGGDFAPLPLKIIKEIQEEREDPFTHDDRATERVIPKPYSPATTKEAWINGERRLQILEWFFTEKNLWAKVPTEVKLKAFMKRHMNAARRLAAQEWKKSELREAKLKAVFNPEMEEAWTLETIEKYLTK